MIEFDVRVIDKATGQLVTTPLVIRVDAGLSGTVRNTNPANFYAGAPLSTHWVGDVEVIAAGYAPWTTGANPQVTFGDKTVTLEVALDSFNLTPRPVPVPRGPLPSFPAPVNYRTSLPWVPPQDRDFLRADSWGVEVSDAPWVPGADPIYYTRILSWFVDRYTPEIQDKYLKLYGGYGYTHLKRSYDDSCGSSDSLGNTRPPGNEQTLSQFVASCKSNKRYVKYVQVVLGSKYFSPWNMTLEQYQERFEPVIDALIAAKAVDEFIPGWEWDLWNGGTAGPISESIFRWVGQKAHAAGISCWLHFSAHVTSWQANGQDRFSFWDALGTDVNGINYQTDPSWNNKDTQDRLVDTLWWFGQRGNIWKLRFDEDQASPEWNTYGPNGPSGISYPEYANQRGFLACCTIDDVRHTDAKVWGYGNGGRMPDGSWL